MHGVNGVWGVLALGLFADGAYGDGWNGVPGTVTRAVLRRARRNSWPSASVSSRISSGCSRRFFIFFKIVDAIIGNRVPAEVELAGLDIPEMGALAYPDFTLKTGEIM